MKILGHGIAYSGADTPKYSSCCFPGICQLRDGRIMAYFYSVPSTHRTDFHYIMIEE